MNYFSLITLVLIVMICPVQLQANENTENEQKITNLLKVVESNDHDTTRALAYLDLLELFATKNTQSAMEYGEKALGIALVNIANKSDEPLTKKYKMIAGDAHFGIGCLYHMTSRVDSAEKYYKESLVFHRSINDKEGMAKSLNYLGRVFQWRGDNQGFYETTCRALQLQREINDSDGVGLSLIAIADHYDRIGKPDSSVHWNKQALKILRATGNKVRLSFCIYNLGLILKKKGEIEKASSYFFEALKIQKANDDRSGVVNTLLSIGTLYEKKGELQRAEEYYKKAADLNKTVGNKTIDAKVQSNLGIIYSIKGNHEKSLEYFQKSLAIIEKFELGPGLRALCLNEIGEQHNELGNLSLALEYIERSLKVGRGISLPQHTAKRLMSIGNLHFKQGNLRLAEKYLIESFEITQRLGFPKNIQGTAGLLAIVKEKQGDYKSALQYFKLSTLMKDSIENSKVEKLLIEKEAQYKIEKKEQKILLNEKKIKLLKKDRQIKSYTLYSTIVGFILILFIIVLGFFNYNQRKIAMEQEIRNQLALYLKEIDVLKANINTHLIEGSNSVGTMFENDELNAYFDAKLSKRELEVLSELSKGKSNKEISETLFVSVNTVRSHLLNIYDKLDVKNRTQAVKKAGNLSLLS